MSFLSVCFQYLFALALFMSTSLLPQIHFSEMAVVLWGIPFVAAATAAGVYLVKEFW